MSSLHLHGVSNIGHQASTAQLKKINNLHCLSGRMVGKLGVTQR